MKNQKPVAGSGKCACSDAKIKHTEKAQAMPKAVQPSK